MDDYRVMVGFLDHPKTRRLKRRIGQHAVETVLRLWEFATSNSSRRTGDLTGMDNEAIADACRWEDDPDKLVDALRDSGYLDGEQLAYRVHDWRETNPYVATWQERSENAKAAANARWGKRDAPRMRPQRNGNAPSPDPDPDPLPVPDPKSAAPDIKSVWAHWLTKKPDTRRKTLKSSAVEYSLIKKRLADYPPEDLCKAIDGMFLDTWSVEHGKLDIGWALRQDQKNNNVDRFIEYTSNGGPPKPPTGNSKDPDGPHFQFEHLRGLDEFGREKDH